MEKPGQEKKAIAVIPSADKKRFCNVCNSELLKDYSCGKCGIYYQPQEAKHELQIRGLDGREGGLTSGKMPISFIDNKPKRKQTKGKFFDSLEKTGYKFTSYSETNI